MTPFAPLLNRLDLTDVMVTADALHTHRGHAEYLHDRGHCPWIVKANQPRLHTQLLALPVGRHRLDGAKIASACRHTARHPNRALAMVT